MNDRYKYVLFFFSSPPDSKHKKYSVPHVKKNNGQSSQHNIYTEYEQVVQDTENSASSTTSESGRERRSSLGETSKRRGRSREREKTLSQDLPFFPDVIGTEGLLVSQYLC